MEKMVISFSTVKLSWIRIEFDNGLVMIDSFIDDKLHGSR